MVSLEVPLSLSRHVSCQVKSSRISHRDMVTAVLFPSRYVELPKPFQAQDWFRAVLSSSPSPKRKFVSPTHAGKQSHRSQKSHEYHDAGVKRLPNCRPIRQSTAARADEPEQQTKQCWYQNDSKVFCPVPSVPLLTHHLHREPLHDSGLLRPGFHLEPFTAT